MNIKDNINDIYLDICRNILDAPEVNGTNELNNYIFTLKDISKNIITLKEKNISKAYLIAELLWYFNGRNDCEFIGKFASLWNRITDDGITSNSAYGYIVFEKHNFNQLDKIVELLRIDPNSRRAVININIPNEKVIETKDEPCTIALQFLIRDNKLNCTTMMRSNDIWFGLPYDIVFFTTIQKIIANKLNIETGTYTHFVTSLHMYERNRKQISNIVNNADVSEFTLDIDKLLKNKEYLIKIVNKDNIEQICREMEILK